MFSLDIVDSDAFLDMPSSTQALYFHLSMRADDDGFVGNPKKIMKICGSQDDDYKLLIAKRFIIVFEKGICVIKHWKIHNYLRKDTYKETRYLEEKKSLEIKDNKAYTEVRGRVVDGSSTQLREGKVSEDKVSIEREETPAQKMERFIIAVEEENDDWEEIVSRLPAGADVELRKFYSYWTEKNSTGKKQRWQMEKTFEVNRRLATWFSRAGTFKGQDKPKGKKIII